MIGKKEHLHKRTKSDTMYISSAKLKLEQFNNRPRSYYFLKPTGTKKYEPNDGYLYLFINIFIATKEGYETEYFGL